MKKWKSTILPVILTLLILAAGFSGILIAKKIIPDGIDTVKGYDKTAVKNKLITFDEPESLTLFPWNLYNDEKAIPIYEFGDVLPDESTTYLNNFINGINEESFVFEDDIFKKIKIMNTGRYFYIKDAAVTKISNNKKYLLNMAFDCNNNTLLYYDFKPQITEKITPEIKNDANEFISELINSGIKSEKYLNNYLKKFSGWNIGVYLPEIIEQSAEVSYFFYQDKILLCYSGLNEYEDISAEMESNGYYPEESEEQVKTLILFYSIPEKEFSGFSLQY